MPFHFAMADGTAYARFVEKSYDAGHLMNARAKQRNILAVMAISWRFAITPAGRARRFHESITLRAPGRISFKKAAIRHSRLPGLRYQMRAGSIGRSATIAEGDEMKAISLFCRRRAVGRRQ